MDRRNMLAAMALFGAVLTPSAVRGAADPTEETKQDEPPLGRQVAERFAATLSAHDIKGFAALFAANYVNHQTSAAAPVPADVKEGKELTIALFDARLRGLPDLTVTIEAMVATDDMAAASFVYEGTHAGVYLGFAPTGRRLRFTSCDIFAIREGLIAEHWGMGDIAGVLAQLKT